MYGCMSTATPLASEAIFDMFPACEGVPAAAVAVAAAVAAGICRNTADGDGDRSR